MNTPARRDGTPDKKKGRKKPARPQRSGARRTHRGQDKPLSRAQRQSQEMKAAHAAAMAAQRAQDEAAAVYVSNAKPAKRQHITDEERRAALASNKNKDSQNLVRLQKVLASAGVASRRMSEKLIAMGRVEVNGEIVQQMGLRIDPHTDIVRVDGTRVQVNDQMVYFILNKPRGVHSTMSDELGRPCVGDFITERLEQGQGLFHVGRLDAETEGLLLLTNDGELANRLMHPSYQVTKTYMATVLGEVNRGIIRELKDGVELEDGIARADDVQIVDVWQGKSLLRVELHEGRKHIVRRMLKELGYPVQALVRTKIHTVQLGDQKPGSVRAMNASELASLYKVVGL
ncbi:pseudouridine synthase [Corynebacterium sp. zg254]